MSATSPTSLSPTARQMWTRFRGLLLAAAILAVAGVVIAALRSGEEYGLLDPRSTDDHGSKAVAELLKERGVKIKIATTSREADAAADRGATLLVSDPDALTRRQLSDLRPALQRGGRAVLIAPGPSATAALTARVRAAPPAPVQPTPPDCDFPTAARAGDAELGGVRYAVSAEDADVCYVHQSLPTLLRLPDDPDGRIAPHGDMVLIGAPDPLYNERLDEYGNASLVLQLLGSRPHLVWYLPSPAESSTAENGERGFLDLLPEGWSWATLQLTIAAVLAALWRVRRLGPLVPEQLPVSVRASETTEGRARLYRSADARDRAAEALRTATRARLAPLVGVSPGDADSPDALTHALATSSHSPAPVEADTTDSPRTGSARLHSLLFGPAPTSDEELVRLCDELDHLERHFSAPAPASHLPTDKERTS